MAAIACVSAPHVGRGDKQHRSARPVWPHNQAQDFFAEIADGGIDLFPAARVWIQKDEYDYYTSDAWQSPRTHGGIDVDDVLELVKRNTQGKVSFVHGDDDTSLSGITFGVGGKHTWASQFVAVQGREHMVVLASDNMYLYENLDTHKAIAQTLDAASNLRTQDRMRSIVSEARFLVPGHDPGVFTRFPRVSDRIVRIE